MQHKGINKIPGPPNAADCSAYALILFTKIACIGSILRREDMDKPRTATRNILNFIMTFQHELIEKRMNRQSRIL